MMSNHLYSQKTLDVSCLDKVLQNVYNEDQKIRQEAVKVISQKSKEELIAFKQQLDSVDNCNQHIVFGILDSIGWPSELSTVANQAIFLTIDHADLSFQKKYIPLVEERANQGVLEKSSYATLLDRILMRSGEMQVYGTQTVIQNVGGEDVLLIWPIENPDKIDSLRVSMDLIPLNKYIEIVSSTYKKKCYWDESLKIEEIKFGKR